MSKIHGASYIRPASTVDGAEVRAALRETLGEFNGSLDRENVNGLVVAAKFKQDTFNRFWWAVETTPVLVERLDSAGLHQWYDVPGLEITVPTSDGFLEVETIVSWVNNIDARHTLHPDNAGSGDVGPPVAIGIEVDGTIVARSPAQQFSHRGSLPCNAYVAVGAGTHIVKTLLTYVGVNRQGGGSGFPIGGGFAGHVEFDDVDVVDRTLTVRHGRR